MPHGNIRIISEHNNYFYYTVSILFCQANFFLTKRIYTVKAPLSDSLLQGMIMNDDILVVTVLH